MVTTFLCSLAGGSLAVLGLSRIEPAAHRLIQRIGMIALAASTGVAAWWFTQGRHGGTAVTAAGLSVATGVGAALLILLAPLAARHLRRLQWIALIAGGCGLAASCLSTWPPPSGNVLLSLIGQLLGAALLGSVTVAWLLGHAYLTATQLTMLPLRNLSKWFSATVTLRVAFLIAAMGFLYASSDLSWTEWVRQAADLWLMLTLRLVVGLLGVGVFAYLVADCVRLRSTQSATGILYFASVFVYIGEICSLQLAQDLGLPL